MTFESFARVACAGVLGVALVPTLAAAAPQISSSSSNPGSVHTLDTSTFLAGYQITVPGISRASMSFIVPTMNCPTSDTQGTALGIGNEQVFAAPTLLGVVFVACVSGAPFYQVQALAGGTTNTGSASAGDRITVTVLQKRTKVTVTVTNITTATKTSASGAPTPDNSMTFGAFPLFSGPMLPVADFGTLQMLNPYLENALLRDWSPTKIERSDGTNTQISVSTFSTNGAFKLKFQHN